MKIIDNWKTVAGKAWSMRLAYLIAIFGAAQAALPYFDGLVGPRSMGVATAILALLLGTLRIVDQEVGDEKAPPNANGGASVEKAPAPDANAGGAPQ